MVSYSGDRNIEILQIDGLTMEPLEFFDLDPLAAIWADPEVTRFLPSRGVPIPRENVESLNIGNKEDMEFGKL
ncbi:hypothetical protein [Calothrix sp. CCY 0018]|uniref:hypothetical protein n=1 Tax=Calothrix sp. CCY 0018 TaxID=3103864 RepID=UPI0039C63BDF